MGNHLYCSPRSCRVALTALTAPALLTCCLLWVAACSDSGEAEGWCGDHAAQCPGDWDTSRGACEAFCGTGKPGASTHDDCKFAYCSVQVSKCDNQEPGDTSIKACVNQL